MGSFSQWKVLADRGALKRVHWVCGPERILVEEIVDAVRRAAAPSDVDYSVVRGGRLPDAEMWSAAFTYPSAHGSQRLLVIRDAENVKNWRPMKVWFERIRELPGVHLTFVSGESTYYLDKEAAKDVDDGTSKPLKPHVRVIQSASQGAIVRCTSMAEGDMVGWLRSRCPQMSDLVAQRVLVRVGGDLSSAAAVARKATAFGGQLPEKVADALCQEQSSADFADDLLFMRKRQALISAMSVERGDVGRLLGYLDWALELMARLNAALKQRLFDARAVAASQDVSVYHVLKYREAAKLYDRPRVRSCRSALALCDDAYRSGSTAGVLETLAALW